MASYPALPKIMVAPTGARRTKNDHAELPITIPEIVSTAEACHGAGADGIHLHVRDRSGDHVLDCGLYLEVLSELKQTVPAMQFQITTEAVGRYTPEEQRRLVRQVEPAAVSISIKEMLSDGDAKAAQDFYGWCRDSGIAVQHILYGDEDLKHLNTLLNNGLSADHPTQVIFVLGRYAHNEESRPDDLKPYMTWLSAVEWEIDWAVCAFGPSETDRLLEAHKQGGKIRVGFENSLWNRDGSLARDNAERVSEVTGSIREAG